MGLIDFGTRCCGKWAFGRLVGQRTFAASSASAQPVKVDKNNMMKLRKATGYSFVNCRKALIEFGDDLVAAEKWLHELAQKEGWQKAVKLSGKSARQGLIGVISGGNSGAIVEVNCQTDFVAQSDRFRQLTARMATATLALTQQVARLEAHTQDTVTAGSVYASYYNIDSDDVLALTDPEGQLAEALAFETGKLGEKLSVTRSMALVASQDTYVFGYAHPRGTTSNNVLLGQFGTLVALRGVDGQPAPDNMAQIGNNVCLHVVGMQPKGVGKPPTAQQQKEQFAKNLEADRAEKDRNEDSEGMGTVLSTEEHDLLRQQYIMAPEMTVHDYLNGQGVQCVHFVRAQRGDNIDDE